MSELKARVLDILVFISQKKIETAFDEIENELGTYINRKMC